MATLELKLKLPAASKISGGVASKILNIDDADVDDIAAAFTAAVGPVTDVDSLLMFFATNLQGQIQGITQNWRTQQNPQPIPPVSIA